MLVRNGIGGMREFTKFKKWLASGINERQIGSNYGLGDRSVKGWRRHLLSANSGRRLFGATSSFCE